MPTKRLIAIISVTLLATPAFAAAAAGPPADPGSNSHGKAHRPATTHAEPPGPDAAAATKARAYGRHCKGQSKKHVPDQKGTPFSQCVKAMAKMATGKASNPARACAHVSKKHVHGQAGTPYQKCVAAAAKLRGEDSGS